MRLSTSWFTTQRRRAIAWYGTPVSSVRLLKQVPRTEFAKLVSKHQGERDAKGFTCWTQSTAMPFCQLAGADSVREICNGLVCCLGKLVAVQSRLDASVQPLDVSRVA